MYNLHPLLSAFPPVLLSLSVISEIVFLFKRNEQIRLFANQLFVLCCLVTPLTYISGNYFADQASKTFEVSEAAIVHHYDMAKLFLFSIILNGLVFYATRNTKHYIYHLLFLSLNFMLLAYVGFLGGELVFSHGAGVSATIN